MSKNLFGRGLICHGGVVRSLAWRVEKPGEERVEGARLKARGREARRSVALAIWGSAMLLDRPDRLYPVTGYFPHAWEVKSLYEQHGFNRADRAADSSTPWS